MRRGWLAAGAVVAMVVLLVVPAVPVSDSLLIQGNYRPGAGSCLSGNFTSSQTTSCLAPYVYPPLELKAMTSLGETLLGLGQGPFPEEMLVTQGYASALVHFVGSKIAYVEGPFSAPVVLDPPNELQVSGVSIILERSGLVDISAVARNVSNQTIIMGGGYFDLPGFGSNWTVAGVTWHANQVTICANDYLGPGGACVFDEELALPQSLVVGRSYTLSWVIGGFDSRLPMDLRNGFDGVFPSTYHESDLVGNFLVRDSELVTIPGSEASPATPQWMQQFVGLVNEQRSATLVENLSLDGFARQRFLTAAGGYTISDYGFDNQSKAFLGSSSQSLGEEIIYPNSSSPGDFVTFLRGNAMAHWAELESPQYTQFGYYFGYGPVVEVNPGCSAPEITQRNINITSYAMGYGCKVEVGVELYLLVILGS